MQEIALKKSLRPQSIVAKISMMAAAVTAMMLTMVPVHAAGEWTGLGNTLDTLFSDLQTTLYTIVAPIAACALIFCFIMMIVSQSQKKVDMYRTWCFTIIIGIVAIFAVPFIIGLAQRIGEAF